MVSRFDRLRAQVISVKEHFAERRTTFCPELEISVNMSKEHRPSVTPSGHRKSVAEEPVTSVLKPGEIPVYDRELSADEEVLAALGYKPEFKREFSLWTTFCVSFAVLGLLPSFASTLYYGMGYSGTPGMVWGWIIAMLFIQCVAAGMGE